VTAVRTRFAFLALLCVAAVLAWTERGLAGEQKEEWTRADLVAALERGPGPTKGSVDAPVTMVYFTDFQWLLPKSRRRRFPSSKGTTFDPARFASSSVTWRSWGRRPSRRPARPRALLTRESSGSTTTPFSPTPPR
jgi:hypothetical protein